jgi:glutathione reductase (NADPH)
MKTIDNNIFDSLTCIHRLHPYFSALVEGTPFIMKKKYDFDLFTIGAGSGGVRASRFAADLGVKVAIAEKASLGGTCVNVGCIPKKLFSYAAHMREEFNDTVGYGWSIKEANFNWARLVANKNIEIERLNKIYQRLLENPGVKILPDHAKIVGPHEVSVGGHVYSADRILIATGGEPFIPQFPGNEHVFSSNEAFFLKQLPKKIVVVGGGYIATEFAGIFNGLGCETTQIYRGSIFLRGFDLDARVFLSEEMANKGVNLKFDNDISAIKKTADGLHLKLKDGQMIKTDAVMYATGRNPLTSNLGLDSCGVKTDSANAIIVDRNYQTNVESIYAIGDVTNRINLTPVALAEGMALVAHLYQDHSRPVSYENIPCAVFSQPNLACVGYTEESARQNFSEITVFKSSFRTLKNTLSGNTEKTLMKLVVNKANDKVIGAHMVGPDAGESIQGLAIALKAGATKAMFDSTIGIHPTSAEEWVTMREPSS